MSLGLSWNGQPTPSERMTPLSIFLTLGVEKFLSGHSTIVGMSVGDTSSCMVKRASILILDCGVGILWLVIFI